MVKLIDKFLEMEDPAHLDIRGEGLIGTENKTDSYLYTNTPMTNVLERECTGKIVASLLKQYALRPNTVRWPVKWNNFEILTLRNY